MALILIIEDEPEINALMAMTLRRENYEVLQAYTGAHALKLVEKYPPDLMLMDVVTPEMSGYEMARLLRENPSTAGTPIIFVIGKHNVEDLAQELELAADYVRKPFAEAELLARVRSTLRMHDLQEKLRRSNERLVQLATTDDLTGLSNRRGFEVYLEDELWRARRFGHTISVAMFDLDEFKIVNDMWGHVQGDLVLRAFSKVLYDSSRRVDKVARFGGEEFVALLPATDAIGAAAFAEKVRAAIATLEIPCFTRDGEPAPPLRVTVSGGVAVARSLCKTEAQVKVLANNLVQAADRCLYQAKAAGRDQIVVQTVEDLASVRFVPVPPVTHNPIDRLVAYS